MLSLSPLACLQRMTDSAYHRWLIGIVPLGLLAILFSSAVAYYQYDAHLSQQKEQLGVIGTRTAANFDHEISLREYSVRAMRKTAEQYLNKRSQLTLDPALHLRRIESMKGYTLDRPAGYKEEEIGSITGAGAIPAKNSPVAREIAMAMGLLPLFQTVVTRDNDTPWVYYTSKNRFTSLYPRVSPQKYFYSDKSLEYDVFTMALPKNNPQRKVFWTPPYRDQAGMGMMVSVAAPVYEGAHFRGSIAIDLTLSKLAWLLERYELPHSTVYLYTQGGDYLAGTSNNTDFRPADFIPDSISTKDGNLYTELPLKTAPWRIIIVTSQADMRKNALWYAFPFALVAALLFGSVILLIALTGTLRKVQECSIRDSLTGLYNRRHFDAIADRELSIARRERRYFGLIILDIDQFKLYNDTCGHQAGDTAIKAVSQILTDTLKRAFDIACRVGGEEFAIISWAESPQQIEKLAQLLHTAIDKANLTFSASPAGHITVSAGVAILSPASATSFNTLYAKADQALYRAKEEGRNRVVSVFD